MPYFGFKAKPQTSPVPPPLNCTVPYFGFKAKPYMIPIASTRNCTVPYFGFKAKHAGKCSMWNNIVLCLILDSRQNIHCSGSFLLVLYCALFWIQGKTRANAAIDAAVLYCALFWIQGKTKRGPGNHGYRLYCALFWIQGKTPM